MPLYAYDETLVGPLRGLDGSIFRINRRDAQAIRLSLIAVLLSIAALLLTTETLVSEKPEEKKNGAMPPGGGMGGYDMM